MAGRFDTLPRPIGFVLAGGATLGAMQVGMLAALAEHEVVPDLVVGTSVGALNGALLAREGDPGRAAEELDRVWRSLTTPDVFPGGRLSQAVRVLRGRTLYPDTGLRRLVRTVLGQQTTFAELRLPFGVVTSNVLTGHPNVFTAGPVEDPLTASAAIPGVLPTVAIDGLPYWDGGVTAQVPMLSALRMGAASIVVLDPGDIHHREQEPRGLPAVVVAAFGTAIRQRVLVEAEHIAAEVPVLYLDRPEVSGREPLSFASTPAFIDRAREVAGQFLSQAPVPRPGEMVGLPHEQHHGLAGHEPRFVD